MKPQIYVKPENALKRAEELMEVDKKQRALDTLYEVICNKKNRQWTKTNEQIIKSFLVLCVQFKESHMAKDGLHQYKTICQASSNIKSLEEVINNFLLSAEEQAEKAKKTSTDAAAVAQLLADVDDLENINSPESLLLKAVSGESSQDRADRDLLAPWLKFVWEAYKNCLELLKNNNKVEPLYKEVAKQGFAFCAKYQRKTEFRKLCELIRQHMVQWQKYPSATSIDLSKPETQNNHLETRLLQLNHAITMELWQEAYKAVEDIYTLMNLSRQKTKPQQMFNYYSSLSLIFWKANNQLFHAATLQKLFVLLREQKKTITQTELTKIGTRLLLATLAIPIPPNRSSIDEALDQDETTLEKLKRLSSLLNLPQPPTRLSLLKDLVKYNVIQYAHPQIRDLYKWLEVDFNPLKLSQSVDKCLNFVDTLDEKEKREYSQYVQPIKEITVTRLVKQIAQIYNTIEIKRFVQLAPTGIEIHALEKLIVDSAKHLDLQVRINHQTKSLHFGNDLYVAQKDELPEGPSIQNMPSEQIRNQLVALGGALQQARQLIYHSENKSRLNELALNIANVYRQTHERHHTDLLKRKQLIEKQKEMYESITIERERLRNEKKKQEERDIANKKYNSNASRMYEDELLAQQESEQANQKDQANEILSKEDEEINRQIEQANKERREFLERLKKEEKKYDHFVRACHENEIALIKKFAEDDAAFRKKFWDEKEIERIENMKREQQLQAENKERLFRMLPDKEQFEKEVHEVRQAEFDRRMSEFQVQLSAAREKRLAERKEQRKQERRAAYLKQIEDKKKKEEDEKRKREDEERRKKQDEMAEKQRKREKEIEEKLAKERQSIDKEKEADAQKQQQSSSAAAPQPYRPKAAGGAGFAKPPETKTEETNWRSRGSAGGPSATAASIGGGGNSGGFGGGDENEGGSWRTAGSIGGGGDSGRDGRDDRRFGAGGRSIGGGAPGSENRPPRGVPVPRSGGGDSSSRPSSNRYERSERPERTGGGGDSTDNWRRGGAATRDDDQTDKQQQSRSKW